jgi:deoxyribodipyrimidine photo-lyase
MVRRPWDDLVWPHATAGFFKLRERIPRLLRSVV